MTGPRETVVVGSTLAALNRFVGVYAWRNNTGAAWIRGKFVQFGDKGSPDILGCHMGRFFGVECKTLKGKQSPDQVEWQERIESVGGVYVLARSAVEAVKALGLIGTPHKQMARRYPR